MQHYVGNNITAFHLGNQMLASDMRGTLLSARNFDGLTLEGVDFSGADLRGSNMSECIIRRCRFLDADLVDVCFAETVFEDCDFSHARFGGTMIEGARFLGCRFAGPSVFSLLWQFAKIEGENIWVEGNGPAIPFTAPPVVISGLPDGGTVVAMGGQMVMYKSTIS